MWTTAVENSDETDIGLPQNLPRIIAKKEESKTALNKSDALSQGLQGGH